ncbi:uncharacterized protein LOC107620200 [Arachis ipaensis]|uniref:uncharacterized protein LOC107620200 n=1 Tax=Arachis ipaensis TaxID=130454 RepID=UPI0007AF1D77|nr:uncharacterized protein LOC107620200 [Arachis ipaensis]XP_025684740.1 uncharacterized protein LOC112785492 [Arachis hypogaea]
MQVSTYANKRGCIRSSVVTTISPRYTIWLRHGEKPVEERSGLGRVDENMISQVNQMHQMVNEAFNFTMQHGSEDITTIEHAEDDEDVLPYLYEGPSRVVWDFNDLLSDGEQELYLGCSKYSKLSFLVKLYHFKCMCSVSDKAMSMILDLLQDAFEQEKLPKAVYEARKTIRKLGIEYNKIDACPNDCMLYRGDDENLTKCKKCECSRWNKTSSDMLWHKQACNNDGFFRHPMDAEAWKKFDAKYTNFSTDLRNTSFILSTLIPGLKMPGNDIDVYLQPLIDELKQLWDGIETYDAKEGNTFKMCAVLMWTISDFLGLENLSGWNTHSVKGRDPPKKLSGTDVLRQQSNVHLSFGKSSTVTSKKRRNGQNADEDDSHWKKKNVFFDLPYWEDQMLRHNLDVMHIEKNVCDNVVFTILNDSGKSKDNLKAHRDLQCMGIRLELWPGKGGKYPVTIFTMSNSQRDVFLKTLQNVVFPDGYSSNVDVVLICDSANGNDFFPSFFTVMVHLTVHLVDEVTLGGPVHYRWIYLDNIETRINRPGRVDDEHVDDFHNSGESMFLAIGKALGAVWHFELTPMEKHQAHRHVLVNCVAVVPFVEEKTKRSLRHQTRSQAKIDSVVHAEFPRWFKHEVPMESTLHSKDLKLFACGPMIQARRFGAYNVNGYKFRTIIKENRLKTQNNGVYVSSNTRSYASMCDNRVVVGGVPYYGKIVDIIELNYNCSFTVVLFKCVWADTTTSRGIKQDHLGLTSVNFSRPIHTGNREEDEPYILASEAQLVYYVDDEVAKEWSVVVLVKPRDLYDMGEENEEVEVGFSPQPVEHVSGSFFYVYSFCYVHVDISILPEYSGEIVPDSLDGEESDSEDNLDDISSVVVDRSMQFDLNKVSEENNETLEDQQRQDDIHVKKMCFDLNKRPWYGDEISDPVKREAHRFLTEYFLRGQYDVGEKF